MAKRANPTYYAGDLKADLIAEAVSVIEESGVSAVSLRDLSKRLGVSHAAPANHFATKNDLFIGIARQGFLLLSDELNSVKSAAGDDLDPVELLEELGLTYVSFAADHPGHFAVMFRGDLRTQPEVIEEGVIALGVLGQSVVDAQKSGWRTGADPDAMVAMLWAVVHGYAHLEAERFPQVSDAGRRRSVVRLALHAE